MEKKKSFHHFDLDVGTGGQELADVRVVDGRHVRKIILFFAALSV
jgi:hypothetical protein